MCSLEKLYDKMPLVTRFQKSEDVFIGLQLVVSGLGLVLAVIGLFLPLLLFLLLFFDLIFTNAAVLGHERHKNIN